MFQNLKHFTNYAELCVCATEKVLNYELKTWKHVKLLPSFFKPL